MTMWTPPDPADYEPTDGGAFDAAAYEAYLTGAQVLPDDSIPF